MVKKYRIAFFDASAAEHPIVSEPHKATMELSTTVGVALESLGVTSLSFTLDFAAKSPSSRLSVSILSLEVCG